MNIEDNLYRFLSLYKKMPDWAKKIISFPTSIIPRYYLVGNSYKAYYKLVKEFEYETEERIREFQFIKIKQLLYHAYNTVPYYKNKWDEINLNINKVYTLSDFSKLVPSTTREDVQRNPKEFVSQKYSFGQQLVANSGGTSGIPLELFYLKGESRAAEWAHMHYQWERVGFKPGERLARLRGDYFGKNKNYTFDPYRNFLILSSFNINESTTQQYIELLNRFKVMYINAYPASIYNLIQCSGKERISVPSLKTIFLGSENMFDWQIARIKEVFQVERVYCWYGHGELTALGGGCELNNNYHFFPTYGYVEFIKNSDFLNCEDAKEIVGTSFINPLMPLIRYKTKDYAIEHNKKCECGRNHKMALRILGREQEIAVGINNERITLTALIFGRHLDYFNHIIKMQIINESPGELRVKVLPKNSFSQIHITQIQNSLTRKEGMPFNCKVEITNEFHSASNGKHKFFIRDF